MHNHFPRRSASHGAGASFHPHLGPPRVSLGLEGVGHKDTVVAVPRPRSGSVPEALRLRLRVRSMLTAPTPSSWAPES